MSVFTALGLSLVLFIPCPFAPPVDGPVVRDFAPVGSYGGHWGVDFEVEVGTPVEAAASGRVSFAGRIAGRLSITVDHGGGVRTSYSYLEAADASVGDLVTPGVVLGRSGIDAGIEALHFSLRVGASYVRPLFGSCSLVPGPGLALGSRMVPR